MKQLWLSTLTQSSAGGQRWRKRGILILEKLIEIRFSKFTCRIQPWELSAVTLCCWEKKLARFWALPGNGRLLHLIVPVIGCSQESSHSRANDSYCSWPSNSALYTASTTSDDIMHIESIAIISCKSSMNGLPISSSAETRDSTLFMKAFWTLGVCSWCLGYPHLLAILIFGWKKESQNSRTALATSGPIIIQQQRVPSLSVTPTAPPSP